ncbi:MAG: hypothetical protein ACOZIN_12320 [Myxococcota bacterium]
MPLKLQPSPSRAIRAATAVRRSTGPEGIEALLTPREVDRVRSLFQRAPKAVREELQKLLAVPREGASLRRGLLLRAMAARADALLSGQRLPELRAFASRLGTLTAAKLREKATALDLDSRHSSSAFDPSALWDNQGLIRDRGGNDQATDNDGLFQRFTASCGPTVVQMMIAEADPVAAFALHDAGLTSDATHDGVAAFQKKLLRELGGVAIGRREVQLRARLGNAIGRLRRSRELNAAEANALSRYALDQGPLDEKAKHALGVVRSTFKGFPDAKSLARLRKESLPRSDEGIGTEDFLRVLNRHVAPLTGARYALTSPPDGFARGQAWRHLDSVEKALRRGFDVPFGIDEPAHWMLLTAVRGKAPDRAFLVSDPDGGRTTWVTEKDLVSGVFGERPFQLNRKGERPYVDCFLLPVVG